MTVGTIIHNINMPYDETHKTENSIPKCMVCCKNTISSYRIHISTTKYVHHLYQNRCHCWPPASHKRISARTINQSTSSVIMFNFMNSSSDDDTCGESWQLWPTQYSFPPWKRKNRNSPSWDRFQNRRTVNLYIQFIARLICHTRSEKITPKNTMWR